jgi:hypothetical protein
MRAQGQAMRAQTSNAAALGPVVGKLPSYNVAALNPMAMGEIRDAPEIDSLNPICGLRNSANVPGEHRHKRAIYRS